MHASAYDHDPAGRPLVSVVVPCFRNSKTLSRALTSIDAQTYKPLEVIVINDCSPETEALDTIMAAFPAVRYVKNDVNLGPSATRNRGIELATGDIVGFLDADDEYHPDKIATQMASIGPRNVVTCGTLLVSPDGSSKVSKYGRSDAWSTSASKLVFRNTLNGAAMLAPKKLLMEVGLYEPALRAGEDFDLYLRLLEAGAKVKNVGRPLYIYHKDEGGLSNHRGVSAFEYEVVRRYIARRPVESRNDVSSALVIFAWLIRHLYRGELRGDPTLVQDALDRARGLEGFQAVRLLSLAIGNTRALRPLALASKLVTAALTAADLPNIPRNVRG